MPGKISGRRFKSIFFAPPKTVKRMPKTKLDPGDVFGTSRDKNETTDDRQEGLNTGLSGNFI